MKELLKDFDEKTFNIMLFTQKLSIFISLIGIIGLFICLEFFTDLYLYYFSIALFKTALLGCVCSLCFGIFFNNYKKGLLHK